VAQDESALSRVSIPDIGSLVTTRGGEEPPVGMPGDLLNATGMVQELDFARVEVSYLHVVVFDARDCQPRATGIVAQICRRRGRIAGRESRLFRSVTQTVNRNRAIMPADRDPLAIGMEIDRIGPHDVVHHHDDRLDRFGIRQFRRRTAAGVFATCKLSVTPPLFTV
jgi:hypothetical protein